MKWVVEQDEENPSCPECRRVIYEADFTSMPVLDRMVGRMK